MAEKTKSLEERLEEYIQKKMPEVKDVKVSGLNQSTEGISYQTFPFNVEWVEKGKKVAKKMLIRADPPGGVGLVPPYDVRPQFYAQQALHGSNVPVPNVFWLEMDKSLIGEPCYFMDWIEGDVAIPWGWLKNPLYDNPPELRHSLAVQLVEIMANIHMFDWKAKGLDKHVPMPPTQGTEMARLRLAKWEGILKKNRVEAEPLLAEALNYLHANLPETKKLVLTHGDFRIGNILVRDGRIQAMLDWESTEIGDPMMDIGYAVQLHWTPDDHSKTMNVLEKEEFYELYERFTGEKLDRERLRWWRIMELIKNIAILIVASRIVIDGTSDQTRMMIFGVQGFPMEKDLCSLLL